MEKFKYCILTLVGKHKIYAIPKFLDAIEKLTIPPETLFISAVPEVLHLFPKQLKNGIIVVGVTGAEDLGDDMIHSTTSAREKLRTTFLNETNYEWCMWLDNDILVPEDMTEILLRMLKKYPDLLMVHSFHPYRLGNGHELRHGMGSCFVHRDLMKIHPFTRAVIYNKNWGDDQIFLMIISMLQRLFKINVKKGTFFNVGHLRRDGTVIKLRNKLDEW